MLQRIVREVLLGLTSLRASGSRPIIVLLTGGTLGLPLALEALKKCNEDHFFRYTLVCTTGACSVHDIEALKEELKADLLITEAEKDNPLALLSKQEGLLVPVLSRSTVARTVNHDYDRLGSALILEALMYNIPVVAAVDAADPENREWESLGVRAPAPGLVKSLKRNYEAFSAMGITLTSAVKLQSTIEETLMARPSQTTPQKQSLLKGAESAPKMLVSAADVRLAQAQKKDCITLNSAQTIITPLAREVAEELGICFELHLK